MNASHEQRDADVTSLFFLAIVLLLAVTLVCFGIGGLMHFLAKKQSSHEVAPARPSAGAFPLPRLETQPAIELKKVRSTEEARLNSYGWIDRNVGSVHIPIERAIELIISRGLPEVGAGQTSLQLMRSRSIDARPPEKKQ
jgi:hypothetical protein